MALDVADAITDGLLGCGKPSGQSGPAMIRLLLFNAIRASIKPFPTLPGGSPNPSSQLGWAPATNIILPSLADAWITGNHYGVSASAINAFCPNYNLRVMQPSVAGTTVNFDMRNPPGTTTHWQSGRAWAAYNQALLRASALPNASGFLVQFDDEQHTPHFNGSPTPTFQWRIACPGHAFRLTWDSNTVLTTMGFVTPGGPAPSFDISDDFYSGVAGIHTDEYVIVDLEGAALALGDVTGAPTGQVAQYRWLALARILCNIEGVEIRLSDSLSDLETDSGSYTVGSNKFQGSGAVGYGAPLYGSATSAGAGVPVQTRSRRYWVSDIGSAREALLGAGHCPSYRYAKIRLSDPSNLLGHVGLSYAGFYAGFYTRKSIQRGWTRSVKERTKLTEGPSGARSSQFYQPSRVFSMKWGPDSLSDNDLYILEAWRSGMLTGGASQRELGYDAQRSGGQQHPIFAVVPEFDPSASGASDDYSRCALFGYPELAGFDEFSLVGKWGGGSLTVQEEPLP